MSRTATLTLWLALAIAPVAGAARSAEAPPAPAPAVTDALHLLDLWIGEHFAYHGGPGLSIGIVHGDRLIWSRGYGHADLASRVPATPSTLYRQGSITKLFTATAVMQLRDAGELELDAPLARYLPGFQVHNPFPGRPAVTLRQLLTHTSGLPRDAPFPYWTTHEFPTRRQILEAVAGLTLRSSPGESYRYSNLGMALLGAVVEEVSGQPWADYVASHVAAPLGMTSTTAAPSPEQLRHLATLYMRRLPDGNRRIHAYYDTGGIAPAANLVSTVEDMARFAALQLAEGLDGGSPVLAGTTLTEMHRPAFVYRDWSGGRGLGFAVSGHDGSTLVSHGGWIGGHRSYLLLDPEQGVAVVAMTNADDLSPAFFGRRAYEMVRPALAAPAADAGAIQAPADPSWQRYLGVYSDPWGWQYEVLVLDGKLVMYEHEYPPADDPQENVTRLTPAGERAFRLPDGDPVVFELGPDDRVVRVQRRYDYLYPVDAEGHLLVPPGTPPPVRVEVRP